MPQSRKWTIEQRKKAARQLAKRKADLGWPFSIPEVEAFTRGALHATDLGFGAALEGVGAAADWLFPPPPPKRGPYKPITADELRDLIGNQYKLDRGPPRSSLVEDAAGGPFLPERRSLVEDAVGGYSFAEDAMLRGIRQRSGQRTDRNQLQPQFNQIWGRPQVLSEGYEGSSPLFHMLTK